MNWIKTGLIALLILSSTPSFAYNFLHIHPTTGKPVGWEPGTTIQYYLDPGPLGGLTNDQAHTLLKEAMKIWETLSADANVPKFEFAGFLPEDVDGTNYKQYVSLSSCFTNDLASCPTDAQKKLQTVIVFDQDSSILQNELCKIVSCTAAAGARVFSGGTTDPKSIVQGIAVFGANSTGSLTSSGVDATVGTFVHELGHLLGMAHTYLNQQNFGERHFPTMMGIPPVSGATPTPDDIAGISTIYSSELSESNTATIKGRIFKSDESPMIHVNVIVRNIDDPLCEAYSFLSGRNCEAANTSLCETSETNDSSYTISNLPEGTYTVEVEEVADETLAFTLAPGLIDPLISGDSEFWNEGDSSSDPSNFASSTITLTAGETIENVDIILNRSEVTDSRIKFIPTDTFIPGPGTLCPEEPSVDYAAMIGIDEPSPTPPTISSSGGCSLIQ